MSTLTLLCASPYALKYRLVSDGADVTKSQAQMITDANSIGVPSIIGDLLEATTTDAAWAALSSQTNFSIYTTLRTVTAGVVMVANVPGVRIFEVSPCGDTGEVDVELRYIHSFAE